MIYKLSDFQTNSTEKTMDFELLKQKIEIATKNSFAEIFEKCGTENIYGFALYSDEGAMTVCPSTNTVQHLSTTDQVDSAYYKFEPAEWKYEMEGADVEFNEICTLLRNELSRHEGHAEWFENFRRQLYSACIDTLENLKNEGFFRGIIGEDVFLIFSVSGYEFHKNEAKNIITRLNNNKYKNEYLTWMSTWD